MTMVRDGDEENAKACLSSRTRNLEPAKPKPRFFLGLDHVRGNFRCWEQHILGLFAIVVLAFSAVGTAERQLEHIFFKTDWDSTIILIIYIAVCAPVAMLYQAVHTGNQPGSPWAWCLIGATLCFTFGVYQLMQTLTYSPNSSATIATSSARAIQSAAVACWWCAGTAQVCYALNELCDLPLPSKLRHHDNLRIARMTIVRSLLAGDKQHHKQSGGDKQKSTDPRARIMSVKQNGGGIVLTLNPTYHIHTLGDGHFEVRPCVGHEVNLDMLFFVDDSHTNLGVPQPQSPHHDDERKPSAILSELQSQSSLDCLQHESKLDEIRQPDRQPDGNREPDGTHEPSEKVSVQHLQSSHDQRNENEHDDSLKAEEGSHEQSDVGDDAPVDLTTGADDMNSQVQHVDTDTSRAARVVRSSRPPIVYASVIGSIIVLIIFGVEMLTMRLRRLGRIAGRIRDIAKLIDDNDRASRRLRNYADFFETFEDDINASLQVGGWASLIFMMCVVALQVRTFDAAVVKAAKGKYRRLGSLRSGEQVGYGTALLGTHLAIALLGFLFFAMVLTVMVIAVANHHIRQFAWTFRTFVLSYCVAYIAKTYILQPFLFHSIASDGFLIRRDVVFYCCNIAWTAYSAFVGIPVALCRLLTYIMYSVIASADLSSSLLPEHLQYLDYAHMTYTSAVHLHNHHHNTIVHTCVDNLLSTRRTATCHRARNKWHLAYTLLHNPQLRSARRHRLRDVTSPCGSRSTNFCSLRRTPSINSG